MNQQIFREPQMSIARVSATKDNPRYNTIEIGTKNL